MKSQPPTQVESERPERPRASLPGVLQQTEAVERQINTGIIGAPAYNSEDARQILLSLIDLNRRAKDQPRSNVWLLKGGTQMAVENLATANAVELASSWVNMMLYMLEIVMCVRYFQRSTFRPLPHKIGVGATIFFDTLSTISVDADVLTISLVRIQKESPVALVVPSALNIFFTNSTAVIAQFFWCHLYFIITRKRIVSLGLGFLGLVHVGLSFSAAIMFLTSPIDHVTFAVAEAGAIACGINDLLIAGCLAYELFKIRRTQSSNSGVLRVFVLSVSSGVVVASTTFLMVILFLKRSIAFFLFFSCQGRIYALTLLLNFPSGTSSGNVGGGESDDGALFSINAKTRPPASLLNVSQESPKKGLPPLPVTAGLQITTLTQFASAHFSTSSTSSPGVWTPRTPGAPRTIIAAPYRISSLPSARALSGQTT